jgi:hypothetical protein
VVAAVLKPSLVPLRGQIAQPTPPVVCSSKDKWSHFALQCAGRCWQVPAGGEQLAEIRQHLLVLGMIVSGGPVLLADCAPDAHALVQSGSANSLPRGEGWGMRRREGGREGGQAAAHGVAPEVVCAAALGGVGGARALSDGTGRATRAGANRGVACSSCIWRVSWQGAGGIKAGTGAQHSSGRLADYLLGVRWGRKGQLVVGSILRPWPQAQPDLAAT